MKVTEGIEMLEILINLMGKESIVHPVLIKDDNNVVLVDTGYPGQFELIRETIEKTGTLFKNVNMIIFTHQDIDHIGSGAVIKKELGNSVKMASHETEKPYIQGDRTPVKLAMLESKLETLPQNMKDLYEKLSMGFKISRVSIDKTLEDKEELPVCGGIEVVYTPGHTPGHICLYLKKSKTLIAGDALMIENGNLVFCSPFNVDNIEQYKKSIKKLAEFDIENVICYHGGLFNTDANKRIRELADSE